MKKTFVVVACVALILLQTCSQAEILPAAFCSYCVNLFRFRGCLENETFFCKMLALKFNLSPLGQNVCDAFPCQGYGQTGNTCTGFIGCPVASIEPKGICPLNQLCCSSPRADTGA